MSDRISPEVYDLAYSYRDYGNESDHLEYNWQKAAETDNQAVLDIACGTGRHLEQFNQRGYECSGLDVNPDMIEFCKARFVDCDPPVKLYSQDMRDFKLEAKYGLAINMQTSANLILDNQSMQKHLRSVARVLDTGGIYILEMHHPREFGYSSHIPARSWEVIRGDTVIQADFSMVREDMNPLTQLQHSMLTISVVKDDEEVIYREPGQHRVYLYLEFLSLVENAGGFDPLVCYGTFNSEVILDNSRRSWRQIHVLRRNENPV